MLADRSSRTALVIAQSTLFMAGERDVTHLIPPESVELARAVLRAHSTFSAALHRVLRAPGLRSALRGVEAALLPGIQLHYVVRKRFLDDAARLALDAGARQVVVIGAGYDSLALRLSRRPEAPVCIEVDHPATGAKKRAALARLDAPTGELRLVSAELGRESLEEALHRARYDPGLTTFFVAEGLSMYLREGDVRGLLSTCAAYAPAGSRFAWTFMEPLADGSIGFRRSRRGLVDAWLRARGEPFTWGVRRDQVAEFVRPLGWEVIDMAGDEELRTRYLAGDHAGKTSLALAAGEVACVLRKP